MNGYTFRLVMWEVYEWVCFVFSLRLVYEWGGDRGLQPHIRTKNHDISYPPPLSRMKFWSDITDNFKLSTLLGNRDKKEEIWASPMTKAPTPTEMSKEQSDNTNNATKKFD